MGGVRNGKKMGRGKSSRTDFRMGWGEKVAWWEYSPNAHFPEKTKVGWESRVVAAVMCKGLNWDLSRRVRGRRREKKKRSTAGKLHTCFDPS